MRHGWYRRVFGQCGDQGLLRSGVPRVHRYGLHGPGGDGQSFRGDLLLFFPASCGQAAASHGRRRSYSSNPAFPMVPLPQHWWPALQLPQSIRPLYGQRRGDSHASKEGVNMKDPVLDFLAADSARRVELLDHPETASAVRKFLGDEVFSELTAISHRGIVQDHLGVKSPPHLVFVPGVMGRLLQSDTKGGVWWLDVRTRQHLDDLGLAPDGVGDSDANNQV